MKLLNSLKYWIEGNLIRVCAGVILLVVLLLLATGVRALTPGEMAIKLDQSVAELNVRGGHCTTTKIGAKMWLTARHCIRDGLKIETEQGYLYPRSVLIAMQDKSGSRTEDWAIINTSTEEKGVPALQLGCNDTVYPGMSVAYLGYPAAADRAFLLGYVSTLNKLRNNGRNDADFVVDLPAAGGASGSAIVSMDTGNIIGILVEGVAGRSGFFLAAAESIKNLDWCEDYNEQLKLQEDMDGEEEDPVKAPTRDQSEMGHT